MIQTEQTPNPESLKFISEKIISAIGTEEFQKDKINEVSNLFIKELLGFNGVELVLLSKNFLSVKKTKDVTWDDLKPMVISHLNDYFEKNNQPILNKNQISLTGGVYYIPLHRQPIYKKQLKKYKTTEVRSDLGLNTAVRYRGI